VNKVNKNYQTLLPGTRGLIIIKKMNDPCSSFLLEYNPIQSNIYIYIYIYNNNNNAYLFIDSKIEFMYSKLNDE
jgi:hypothetical protein